MRKKILVPLGLFISALLIGLYIFQLNSATTLAWRVAETEKHFTQLKHQNTTLQAKAYTAVPLRDLQQLAELRNFEKITSITYLKLPNGLVAQNQ